MSETPLRKLLDGTALKRTLERIAHQIIEDSAGVDALALVGVVRKGDILAARLKEIIDRVSGGDIPVGSLDITLYRDDIDLMGSVPLVRATSIPFDITGRTLVLVDDVLFTGRTTRAALDALMDLGRPKAIRFAVLIDRGSRELPIQPDYTGLSAQINLDERVKVELAEDGMADGVFVYHAESGWVPGED
ncbi:MAG: bifunctional pyr operon transcriptional regulator/uracil phosphoribosyltransferase PyrR [Deltaproteobacteria bacterium]|nr:MAG: bifunctional pyr operon transcriptional regulator/uracil phosphoribosyltransferase PyrR [Deltaproteobacteria bacterium]